MLFAIILSTVAAASALTALRDAAAAHGLRVGAAINAGTLASDGEYAALAQTHYNLATAENACKWSSLERTRGVYTFGSCDSVRDFALRELSGLFRGHTLAWGKQYPAWLDDLTADEKRAALLKHVDVVVSRYGADVAAWDVVNEAVSDIAGAADPLRKNVWYPALPDYIDAAFYAAREAAPKGTLLFYNDYSINRLGLKSDRVFNLTRDMLRRGVPIDGIGFQMHVGVSYFGPRSIASFKENVARFAALGMEIQITEMDVTIADNPGADDLLDQAAVYAGVLEVCLAEPACTNFQTWGLSDLQARMPPPLSPNPARTHMHAEHSQLTYGVRASRYTWKGTETHPLPFDEDFGPKPALAAMLAVLGAQERGVYEALTTSCRNATAVSGPISVTSVSVCMALCDAATRTGSDCVAVDTDGDTCFLKSVCNGEAGEECEGSCGFRRREYV